MEFKNVISILERWLIDDAIEYDECLRLLIDEGLDSDTAWKWMDWCNYRDIHKEGITKCIARHQASEDEEMSEYMTHEGKKGYMDALMDDNS